MADYARCIELIETYADLGLGLVDASMVTVAENLGVKTVATLNRRDFTVVRPRHVDALDLIPLNTGHGMKHRETCSIEDHLSRRTVDRLPVPCL